jgi:tetratricopeptide (TPR) repeat protein
MDILENYPDGKEFYWCHWSKEMPSLRALELLDKKDGTLVAIEGFDDAMYDIYKIVDFELDEVLASYEERRNEIRRFIDIFREKYPNTIIEESIQEAKQPEHKPKEEPSTWFEYFEAGYQAYENKDFTTAEKNYKKVIELNPKNTGAYINLGLALAKDTNRLAEAEEMFHKAIEINPNYTNAYNNLGTLLAKDTNRLAEAEEMFHKAIEIDTDYANAYNNFGILLAKDTNRLAEAEDMYHKAIEIDPDNAGTYYNLACLQSISHKEENMKEVFEYLKIAVEMDSKYKLMAKTEEDFDFVRDDERFWEIVGRDGEE